MLPKNSVLLPDDWVCSDCTRRAYSIHLIDPDEECPNTGSPDYVAERAADVARYMADIFNKKKSAP
jgi:hypothetical protein